MTAESIRAIAFYLPQFHPIPENDAWWGKGFTEWSNVVKAKPLFRGHYQPHLPADLGFYDLRLPETREAQANLARQFGIAGFCYYHYWFNGKQLLERPFNEVLSSGEPNFPFCLCWANENWSRAWDGGESMLLMEQSYSEEDDRNHIRALANAFLDDRYIRVGGKPVFLVYRPSLLPNPERTASIWREEALRLGVGGIFLCKVESIKEERFDAAKIGFDAAIEFQPDTLHLGPPLKSSRLWQLARKVGLTKRYYADQYIYDYPTLVKTMLKQPRASYKRFPSVFPSWDNSPRRNVRATIIRNSTPQLYQQWLQHVLETFEPPTAEENLVFITAWNEWAEGNHLEPCQKWGRAYLEATKAAFDLSGNSAAEKAFLETVP